MTREDFIFIYKIIETPLNKLLADKNLVEKINLLIQKIRSDKKIFLLESKKNISIKEFQETIIHYIFHQVKNIKDKKYDLKLSKIENL